MVIDHADNCDEIKVFFDCYDEKLLKAQMHIDEADGSAIHYQVTNET